jgi:hypothetical protein
MRVHASHFPSNEVQDETEDRGSTPVSANDWGNNTAVMAALIEFAPYWASLVLLHATQLDRAILFDRGTPSWQLFALVPTK